MKKYLLLASLLSAQSFALATKGSMGLGMKYKEETKEYKSMLGLNMNAPIGLGFSMNNWSGFGDIKQVNVSHHYWLRDELKLEQNFNYFKWYLTGAIEHRTGINDTFYEVGAGVNVKLW